MSNYTTSASSSKHEIVDFYLETDELITALWLTVAMLISSILIAHSIFYYSKNSDIQALSFDFRHKSLSIICILCLFLLLITDFTQTNHSARIAGTITTIFTFTALMIANVIGLAQYRYKFCDTCIFDKCTCLRESKICTFIWYALIFIIFIVFLLLSTLSEHLHETIMVIVSLSMMLSLLLGVINGVSLMLFIGVFCCLMTSVIMGADVGNKTEAKAAVYCFPIFVILFVYYALFCCQQNNRSFLKTHVGWNVFYGFMSILNRASNFVVFFIWIASNHSGAALSAFFQLFLITITAVLSAYSVQYQPPFDSDEQGSDVLLVANDTKLKKYFGIGRYLTFCGCGQVWFNAATWDKNQRRDDIDVVVSNGFRGSHAIEIYELFYECLPCLALQIVVDIYIFEHWAVTLSMTIRCFYIAMIVLTVIYENRPKVYRFKQNHEVPSMPAEYTGNVDIQTSIQMQGTAADARVQMADLEVDGSNAAAVTDVGRISHTSDGVVSGGTHTSGDTARNASVDYGTTTTTMVNEDLKESIVNCKIAWWIVINFVLLFTDFFLRCIPLWILSESFGVAVMVLVLLVFENFIYWRMIADCEASKKWVNIIQFGWTGVLSCGYYMFSSSLIGLDVTLKYPTNDKMLLIEMVIRLVLNFFVFVIGAIASSNDNGGLIAGFIVSLIFHLIVLIVVFCKGRQCNLHIE